MVRLLYSVAYGPVEALAVGSLLRIVKFISVPCFFWNVKSWWGELEANRCCDCCDASHFVVLVDPNTASGTRQIWPVHVECWCGTLCICTLIPETVRLPLVSIFAPTPCPGSLRYLWGFWGISPLDSCWTINWWDIGGLSSVSSTSRVRRCVLWWCLSWTPLASCCGRWFCWAWYNTALDHRQDTTWCADVHRACQVAYIAFGKLTAETCWDYCNL